MDTRFRRAGVVVLLGSAALASPGLWAQQAPATKEINSPATEREAVALTVYNDNLALVKERRKVDFAAGSNRLSLREVAARMRPETALLRAMNGPALNLLEQNFDFDLLTPQKLLDKYVGQEVTVIRTHPVTGEDKRERATVLAAGQGTVLRFADRIETGVPGRLAFDSVPSHLRDRPTLSVLLDAAGGKQSVELSYLTGGLSWRADYVAHLAPGGKTLDLSAWVTLTNQSGAAFDNATLQLVAGKVNQVRAPVAQDMVMMAAAAPRLAKGQAVAQEALMDFHLYSFERPTSIAENQTKQLALLSASQVPVQHEYLLEGSDWYYRDRQGVVGQKLKPAVFVQFDNKGGALGKPLPAGVVRVYAKDSKGAAQFVGEDQIEHTAKDEKVRLQLGEAFDITADRVQTQFRRVADNVTESTWRIELRNAKDEAVTVRVQEPLSGDWTVLQENHKHHKASARLAQWDVPIPANGKVQLEYSVRVRW